MASPAQILRSCLIDLGLVQMPPIPTQTTPFVQNPKDGSTLCYISSMDDGPDQCISIRGAVGINFGRRMRSPQELTHPGIYIKVRALGYTIGYNLANLIYTSLVQINRTTTVLPDDKTTHYIQSVYPIGNIIDLGEEVVKKRLLFGIRARMAFQDQEPPLG